MKYETIDMVEKIYQQFNSENFCYGSEELSKTRCEVREEMLRDVYKWLLENNDIGIFELNLFIIGSQFKWT